MSIVCTIIINGEIADREVPLTNLSSIELQHRLVMENPGKSVRVLERVKKDPPPKRKVEDEDD